jgi:hypothetical protein
VREVLKHLKRPDTAVQRAIFVVFDRSAFNVYTAALKTAARSTRSGQFRR